MRPDSTLIVALRPRALDLFVGGALRERTRSRATDSIRTALLLTGLAASVASSSSVLQAQTQALAQPATPAVTALGDEALVLPESISETPIELRARLARQWRQADGTLVVMFNGGFTLNFGARKLSSNDAVVWLYPRGDERARRYYELIVYLSERAEVQEPGGSVVEDSVLLVRNLRTYGKITKYHDASSSEPAEESALYQQALRDRQLVEGGGSLAATQPAAGGAALVTRPGDAGKPADVTRPRAAKPPRVVRYRLPNLEPASTPAGEQVFVSIGRVYFSQDGGNDAAVLEIQADAAVVFPAEGVSQSLTVAATGTPPASGAAPATGPAPANGPASAGSTSDVYPSVASPGAAPAGAPADPAAAPADRAAGAEGPRGLMPAGVAQNIRAVYLEGDVVLSAGNRFVRAYRLFYDFENQRALILDAVLRADIPDRGVPLYVRAGEIRQLSERDFQARRAMVSTSEFFSPSYHLGVDKIILTDSTARDAAGRAAGPLTGRYKMTNSTLNVAGIPLFWWPYSEGTLEESETALRGVASGFQTDRGAFVRTTWSLFSLLGAQRPPGWDATLLLDYFSERGPAVGVNADYQQEDRFGLVRGYYLNDGGEDDLGPLRRADERFDEANRGRFLWRHRQYFANNWEATVELSYLSDPNFLEEWRNQEFNEGKEQETLVFLKRAKGVEAFTFLANWRINDWLTQTEHLPELTYRRIGDLLGPVVLYHESRIGMVRYRPDERLFFDDRRFDNRGSTDSTFRVDGRQEGEWPIKLGDFNIVPFATVRGMQWDGQPLNEGSAWRGIGTYGARGGTRLSRAYDDVQSELFDVNRLRHIVRPEFAGWWSHSNTRSELITPFDYGVDTIDAFYGGLLALRQTWQTKRGAEGRERTTDWITFDIEAGFFGGEDVRNDVSNGYVNPWRPENSRSRNYLAGDLIYRLSDTTSFLYDFNFDLNDRSYDRHNFSLAIERNPRLSYVVGTRYAGDIDMSFVGGGFNYRFNEKHITAFRGWWDVDTGQLGEVSMAFVRKLPRWYAALNIEYNQVDDDLSVNLALWPEGAPEWTLGSRRFSGLGSSTGIRP